MNLAQIESQVIDLCKEVGRFMYEENLNFDRSRIEQKGSFSNLVSYVDKESERKLVNALNEILPGAGFLGEEGTDSVGNNEYLWIIDPLDGTTNYLHQLPIYAISIGLLRNNKTVLGVVHEVSHQECFHAIENGKAYCNERVINVSAVKNLSESLWPLVSLTTTPRRKTTISRLSKHFWNKPTAFVDLAAQPSTWLTWPVAEWMVFLSTT